MKTTTQSSFRIILTSLALAAAFISVLGSSGRVAIAQKGTGIIRVSTAGNDNTACGSEAAPCRTIQGGVKVAVSGDTLLVARGTYTYNPAQTPCYEFGTTPAVVCIHGKDLTLLGGYSGSDWSTPDPARYPTIIDGQQANRGVLAWNDTSLRMEGFTVQNGLSQGAASGDDFSTFAYGGGVRVVQMDLTLRNMVFRNNQAVGGDTTQAYGGSGVGGGLAVSNADPVSPISVVLENLTFDGNQAKGGQGTQLGGNAIGGGMHFIGLINVSGTNLSFTNNTATGGSTNGSGLVSGHALSDAQGGAASIYRSSSVRLEQVTATGNRALGGAAPNGSAGAAFGGALYFEHAVGAEIADARFESNLAQGGAGLDPTNTTYASMAEGGAIHSDDSWLAMDRVSIINNTARSGAGTVYRGPVGGGGAALTGIDFADRVVSLTDCIVADNHIELTGTGQKPGGGGGGLWLQGLTANINQTTIARNTLNDGSLSGPGVIVIGPFGSAPTTNATIAYSIISDHSSGTSAVYVQTGAAASFNKGLWSNNTPANTNSGGGAVNGLSTMVSGAANFVSPGAPNYDYHIKGNSAARNQAVGSGDVSDIDDQSRQLFAPADIGADEYLPIVLTVVPVGNGKLLLSWKPDGWLASSTDHYTISFTKASGAANPAEGASPVNAGAGNSFTLSGLTNYKQYTFTIQSRNSSNTVLDSSNNMVAMPVDHFAFLPAVLR